MKIKHSIPGKSDLLKKEKGLKIILLKSFRVIQARSKVFTFFFHVVMNFIFTTLYNMDLREACQKYVLVRTVPSGNVSAAKAGAPA